MNGPDEKIPRFPGKIRFKLQDVLNTCTGQKDLKLLVRAITTGTNSAMNRSQSDGDTCGLHKVRRNSSLVCGFDSHYSKAAWRELRLPITWRSNRNSVNIFQPKLKTPPF